MLTISVSYTEDEYLVALKEKLASMPNKRFHSLWPAGLLISALVLCVSYEILFNGWALSLLFILALMALSGLMGDRLAIAVALWNARRSKKLELQYSFTFDQQGFVRRSSRGEIVIPWRDVLSVDSHANSLIISVARGAIPIPKGQLTGEECNTILRLFNAGRNQKVST